MQVRNKILKAPRLSTLRRNKGQQSSGSYAITCENASLPIDVDKREVLRAVVEEHRTFLGKKLLLLGLKL